MGFFVMSCYRISSFFKNLDIYYGNVIYTSTDRAFYVIPFEIFFKVYLAKEVDSNTEYASK